MIFETIKLIFLVVAVLFLVGFVVYKNLFYKGKRRKEIVPNYEKQAVIDERLSQGEDLEEAWKEY